MSPLKVLPFPITAFFLLLSSTQLRAETDCSRDAIDYYLEKGFTPEQVSRMCQASEPAVPPTNTADRSEGTTGGELSADRSTPASSANNDEEIFFNKNILADSLTITPQTLTYVRDQCIRYGEEDMFTGFKPKVCGVIKTTINRVGLIVLRAVKGVSIFRDAELLVQGKIQREVVNLNSMNSKDRKTFEKILVPAPETLNIETREDANPKEVAARLPR